MATILKNLLGSQTTLITTGSSTANNSLAVGSSFNNTIGQTGDGYTMCDVEFVGSYTVAPAANTGITVWFLGTQDGTNYEDGDGTIGGSADTTPSRLPDVVFPLRAVTGSQRIIRRILMPWGKFKPLMKNDGTGQSLSSGAILNIRPVTNQST